VLVAFSVTPLGVGEAVGEVVAEAVRVVRESGLPNQTDAMFTTVEGDWVGVQLTSFLANLPSAARQLPLSSRKAVQQGGHGWTVLPPSLMLSFSLCRISRDDTCHPDLSLGVMNRLHCGAVVSIGNRS
jgi:hypothetical protein